MAGQDDASIPSGKKDMAWKYNFLADPKDKNSVTCNFCGKVTKGGIYRAKQHQIGGFKNVADCRKTPSNVKDELRNLLQEKKMMKELIIGGASGHGSTSVDDVGMFDDDIVVAGRGVSTGSSYNTSNRKARGNLDAFVSVSAQGSQMRQPNIKEGFDKEMRARTIQKIARFFYQGCISFNCCNLDSFKDMVKAIGEHGPGLKPPSYHEIRVPLLKNEDKLTWEMMEGHREEWSRFGCSIMSDCWTDRKNKSIINFMVNSTKGTMFVESIDAKAFMKTGEKLYDLLDAFVEKIGEGNVVQVISDNGSNYVLAGIRSWEHFFIIHLFHSFEFVLCNNIIV